MEETDAVEFTEKEQELIDQIIVNPVILETVFSWLSPRDIKSVALVSLAWREVVDQPRFWSWAVMRLGGTSGRRWRAGGSP